MAKVKFPQFNEGSYLNLNPDVKAGIEASTVRCAFDHFLNRGIDEGREPLLAREPLEMSGNIDQFLVSHSGFFAIFGWLGDEGYGAETWRLFGPDFNVEIPADAVFRHARHDVESAYRDGPFDYGFGIVGRTPSKTLLKQALLFRAAARAGQFQGRADPTIVSDKRLLDVILTRIGAIQSHAGLEVGVHHFLAGSAGKTLVELFCAHVKANLDPAYVETFRPRPVKRSFVTVLFGNNEPILTQPLLFREMGVDFGEWIYVCNSPEDGTAALRLARTMAELYDVMITVVVMTDNVGFGAANNVAVSLAKSDSIYVINPDVFPLACDAGILRRALDERQLGRALWGGLLFYDERNLMHSGMYMEHDVFMRSPTYNGSASGKDETRAELVRVEHFDKSAPFDPSEWRQPVVVPAISGAVMAFNRPMFEKIGGFSTRYIYGHYEDADLSLRWAEENGPVVVDPDLRFVHLEGQGSRASGPHYHGAKLANRYLFSVRYNPVFALTPDLMTATRPTTFDAIASSI